MPSLSPLRHRQYGFTLVEMMITIGIIGILAAIVITAINPAWQLGRARNSLRAVSINSVLNAYVQYGVEHSGNYQDPEFPPPADCSIPLLPASQRKLCRETVSALDCDFGDPDDGDGCIYTGNLAPYYLVSVPIDPQNATGGDNELTTDYTAQVSNAGRRLTIFAPNTNMPPATAILSVSR